MSNYYESLSSLCSTISTDVTTTSKGLDIKVDASFLDQLTHVGDPNSSQLSESDFSFDTKVSLPECNNSNANYHTQINVWAQVDCAIAGSTQYAQSCTVYETIDYYHDSIKGDSTSVTINAANRGEYDIPDDQPHATTFQSNIRIASDTAQPSNPLGELTEADMTPATPVEQADGSSTTTEFGTVFKAQVLYYDAMVNAHQHFERSDTIMNNLLSELTAHSQSLMGGQAQLMSYLGTERDAANHTLADF